MSLFPASLSELTPGSLATMSDCRDYDEKKMVVEEEEEKEEEYKNEDEQV